MLDRHTQLADLVYLENHLLLWDVAYRQVHNACIALRMGNKQDTILWSVTCTSQTTVSRKVDRASCQHRYAVSQSVVWETLKNMLHKLILKAIAKDLTISHWRFARIDWTWWIHVVAITANQNVQWASSGAQPSQTASQRGFWCQHTTFVFSTACTLSMLKHDLFLFSFLFPIILLFCFVSVSDFFFLNFRLHMCRFKPALRLDPSQISAQT